LASTTRGVHQNNKGGSWRINRPKNRWRVATPTGTHL